MKQEEFIKRLQSSLKTNIKDHSLLDDQTRFMRGKFLFNTFNNVSKTLSIFEFEDKILFENKLPFILIEDVKFLLNHSLYLKHTNKKFISPVHDTIIFLDKFKINPKYIIDLGACWGEFSLLLSKKFPKSKIYSIEGAKNNFETLKINLNYNSELSNNIETYNLIISDHDGFEEILNSVNTMNVLKKIINNKNAIYEKVRSSSLKTFISKLPSKKIDFLKVDIEGSEQNLLLDLKKLFFKSVQIELINYNTIETNINFIKELSFIYNFYDPDDCKLFNIDNMINIVEKTLKTEATIDLFLLNKTIS